METNAAGEDWGEVDGRKADEGFSPDCIGYRLPGETAEGNILNIMGT